MAPVAIGYFITPRQVLYFIPLWLVITVYKHFAISSGSPIILLGLLIGALIGKKDKKWKFEMFIEPKINGTWKNFSSLFALIVTGIIIYLTPNGLNLPPTYLIIWSLIIIALIFRRTSLK